MSAEVPVRVCLDWQAAIHHDAGPPRPCRICGNGTQSRDSAGRPCDKSCAEDEAVHERLGLASTRITDERVPSPANLREAQR